MGAAFGATPPVGQRYFLQGRRAACRQVAHLPYNLIGYRRSQNSLPLEGEGLGLGLDPDQHLESAVDHALAVEG